MKTARSLSQVLALLFASIFSISAIAAPTIARNPAPMSDIIEFPKVDGEYYEAWEVVLDWVDGVYLNYSRAPWGERGSVNYPIIVCSTKTENMKFAGISFSEDQLKEALALIIQDKLGASADTSTTCRTFGDLVAEDGSQADLQKFFDSL